jgi:hypothetical protein
MVRMIEILLVGDVVQSGRRILRQHDVCHQSRRRGLQGAKEEVELLYGLNNEYVLLLVVRWRQGR